MKQEIRDFVKNIYPEDYPSLKEIDPNWDGVTKE